MNAEPRLRLARPEDQSGAYAVCLQTGDSGQDGTAMYADDPDLLGHIYVGPYLHLEPELALVLEDDLGICGYVLGALDSARFYPRMLEEWLPRQRACYPPPEGPSEVWTPSQRLRHELHSYQPHYPPAFAAYPSHAHIDLVSRVQGRGWGRTMMEHLMERMAQRGSPGVHLCVSGVNDRALGFYARLGFTELERVGQPVPEVIYMGRTLAARVDSDTGNVGSC